jgi:tetratricopeptide (TPR) repeat protein/predicted aspartyl protease
MAGALLVLLLQNATPAFAGQCQLRRLEVPITMNGLRPTLTAKINGVDAVFTLDSGAWWSFISPAAAEQYHLRLDANRLPGMRMTGINGEADIKVATVATLTIFNTPVPRVDFLVGGSDPGAGTVGLLGQNLLRIADIEYDLAQGAVRFLQPRDCKKSPLAYWAKPDEPYSMIDIKTATALEPHTVGTAYLNGTRIRVTFDTGSPESFIGLSAAARAGIKPDSPGVEPGEDIAGIGRKWIKSWIATFPSLKIGDEEVHNARLHFADMGQEIDMLLGADFFLSHRVYVASSQSKLYFTYNGGPVFNLAAARSRAKANSTVASSETPASDEDAATIARRAASYAARRDLENALRDYNRACELEPKEATYFYGRGLVEISMQRQKEGVGDIERAIELNPDYVEARLTRAEIQLTSGATADALENLDAVDRLAPKQANLRYPLALLYARAGQRRASIAQLDLWIASHPADAGLAHALNARCWNRAVLGEELYPALDDCNRAANLLPHSAEIFGSRGFVHLRRKEFAKAISDYDAALKINPKSALALYCRGIAKSDLGKADAAADLSAAAALDSGVAERAKRYGVGLEAMGR